MATKGRDIVKQIIFMFFLTVLGTNAYGHTYCESFQAGNRRLGCMTTDHDSEEWGKGSVLQILGKGKCITEAGNPWEEYTNVFITCHDISGLDDSWAVSNGLNIDPNSPIKYSSSLIEHAIYQIPNCGELTTEQIKQGDTKICYNTPAIIKCQLGYMYDAPTNQCITVDAWIQNRGQKLCTESSIQHKVSNAQKKLKTGNNTYLYCYTMNELSQITQNSIYTNSCLAGMHKVRIGTAYHECTPNGWTKHQFSKCASGGDFDTCTGIEHCTTKVIDTSTKKEVATATGTSQLMVSNTGNTYCIQYVCQDGFSKVDNICKANSQIADEKRQRQIQQTNQAKCKNSGGDWSGGKCVCKSEKHLISTGTNTCACQTDYEYNTNTRACDPTNKELLRIACNNAIDTKWDAINKQCFCTAGDNYVFNSSLEKCEMTIAYATCIALGTMATWDNTSKQCKCRDPKQELTPDGTACVETAAARAERLTADATQRVNDAYKNIKAIHDTFRNDVSVWKDADGKFNTARLASDSIAGVVLGTTGGLITSKLVKKNQIEDGFEKLQCTIGGQSVATWGDQFNVGIQ